MKKGSMQAALEAAWREAAANQRDRGQTSPASTPPPRHPVHPLFSHLLGDDEEE